MSDPREPPVSPALSPEEWKRLKINWNNGGAKYGAEAYGPDPQQGLHGHEFMFYHPPTKPYTEWKNGGIVSTGTGRAHGIAALALYGQPFGFTREDVEWLEWLGRKVLGSSESLNRADSLAARIAALLPPVTRW